MAVHQLEAMTWPAFARLPFDRVVAILPLGAIEAHGPHLPLGTDIVIARAMAVAGAARLSARGLDVVVLPPLPIAPAPFAADFAGTVDAPGAATTAMLAGTARSLQRHGVRVTALANAHHDPAHVTAIRAAVAQVNGDGAAPLVFPDLTRRRWASRLTDEFQSGACHAGRYEGSVVLAETPAWVDGERLRDLAPNPHSLVDAIRRGDRTFAAAGGEQAYFGWPAEATADEGRQIVGLLGAILEDAVMEAWDAAPREAHMSDAPFGALDVVNPASLARPRGFSHGMLAAAGSRTLYVAGQTAAGPDGRVARTDFASEFDAALANVVAVVREAGGAPHQIARMTIYVTDMDAYRANRGALGPVWRRHMQSHYPAMALVGIASLVDPGATIEIEAEAAVPDRSTR